MSSSEPIDQILSVKKALLEGWIRTRGQKRDSIHVSDLLHCRRRVCFERLDLNPVIIDEKKMKYFIGGEVKHLQLQNLLGPDFDCEKEVTYTTPKGIRIIGHCDAIHRDTKTCIEWKITESTKVSRDPYSYHLKQLMMYLAILGYSKGVLMYMIIGSTHKVSDYFPTYHITMTEDERYNILERIEKNATELQNGINNRDPNLVGHVLGSSIYRNPNGDNWYCLSCPYKQKCNGYKEFESEDDLQRMQENLFTELRSRRLKGT
jgi:hypothetical protein